MTNEQLAALLDAYIDGLTNIRIDLVEALKELDGVTFHKKTDQWGEATATYNTNRPIMLDRLDEFIEMLSANRDGLTEND